ncbi:PTS sugar transporter subunit IIA [Enterococcus avium]|jgi:PTS system mannitol-specific IIA component|uniref:PTS sugar transporter subunit IIA n=1 Tax=Enterococcus avium TaxID=33945 RepID=UPI00159E34F2|nr:PTS sugar transporter subunit IIA [Enterococcus avium]NVN75468.1 PTS sugar transporter subunit IIA [Enterococcus avium]
MLLDNLTQNDVQVGVQATDWEEAIEKCAQPLVEKGSIEQTYVRGIIDSVKENGPYFVLTKHVALAHTRPEFGANCIDLNFAVLETPVEFGKESLDPIKLIITLAAVDSTSHLDVIADLTDILIDEELLEKILSVDTSEELYELLCSKG